MCSFKFKKKLYLKKQSHKNKINKIIILILNNFHLKNKIKNKCKHKIKIIYIYIYIYILVKNICLIFLYFRKVININKE